MLVTNGEYTIREPRRSSATGSLWEESSFIAKEPARFRYVAAGEDSGVVLEVGGVSMVLIAGRIVQIRVDHGIFFYANEPVSAASGRPSRCGTASFGWSLHRTQNLKFL